MTVVVKIGGARAVNPEGALADIAELDEDCVVVHGGSTAVDDTLDAMGKAPEYVETPSGVVGRFTDEETMDVFKMALPGLVNTDLVTGLQNAGVNAVGLSGVDGGLLTGKRKSAVRVVEDGKKKIRRGDHSRTRGDARRPHRRRRCLRRPRRPQHAHRIRRDVRGVRRPHRRRGRVHDPEGDGRHRGPRVRCP